LFLVDDINYELPFNPDGVKPGKYKGMTQVDPYWLAPVLDLEDASIRWDSISMSQRIGRLMDENITARTLLSHGTALIFLTFLSLLITMVEYLLHSLFMSACMLLSG
jgi:hypothetical protein